MATIGFTQAQLDAMIAAYADPDSSGSMTIENRSYSWNRGNRDDLLKVIQFMKADIAGPTVSQKRSTLATYNRGY